MNALPDQRHSSAPTTRVETFIANDHLTNPIMLNSEALLQGRRVIEINHEGQCYRLSKTRQNKLILTK